MSNDLKDQGYSQEELYFKKMNEQLLEKRRRELDSQKQQAGDKTQQSWWMICPKCGAKMEEINLSGILVDKCNGCHGIHFDAGELETLTQASESKSFLGAIRKLFP